MKRREFLKAALATGAVVSAEYLHAQSAVKPVDPTAVKRVLIVFKCHLDLGFIDTQANVIRKYFDVYYPLALRTIAEMKSSGEDHYVWTTGSWLLYEYLEQASPDARKQMEEAVKDGDIAWHALPFTWQTEIMDRSLIEGSLAISKSLDNRFARTTTGAKMSDVPGHTRGLIAPLAQNGVKMLDIGVNGGSTGPLVPDLFLWKDPSGASLVMMYHRHSYGGVVQVPGQDLAIDVEVRDDNAGPHTPEEIRAIYARLRKQFPNAKVTASNLTEIANSIEPYRDTLPIIEQEIGDTWIYGVPSDPVKVARYRELCRLRTEWIAKAKFSTGDATDVAILRSLLLAVEHTWGTDTKTWLDFNHYTPHDLAEMLNTPKYKVVTHSWEEKRDDLSQAIGSMPPEMQTEAKARMKALVPSEPRTNSMKKHQPGKPFESAFFAVGLDEKTGSINLLRNKKTGRNWASPTNTLGLFSYQTLSKEDYDVFLATYLTTKEWWAPQDFGKPNIDHFGAKSQTWMPDLTGTWVQKTPGSVRALSLLNIHDAESERTGRVAWPHRMYTEIVLSESEPVIDLNFYWFDKASNRMPEAFWLTFLPTPQPDLKWQMEKSGQTLSPLDVVTSGNRHMHALSGPVTYTSGSDTLSIESIDAPVVAFGKQSPINFSNDQPDPKSEIHFSLYNNAWGTNYIQWFGEDMRFRFRIRA